MIPQKIHYCWLSGERFPAAIQAYMESWRRVMPDYELCCWDASRFDIRTIPFVEEACRARKWAFAADYIRLHALYAEGGIYLDVDVIAHQRLDRFLDNRFFSAVEYHRQYVRDHGVLALLHPDGTPKTPHSHIPGICLQAAILGAERGHPFLRDCMDWYRDKHFRLADGRFFTHLLAPDIYAQVATGYGFKYADVEQLLQAGMRIYPSAVFAPTPEEHNPNACAVHCCRGSWREPGIVRVKPTGFAKLKRSIQKRLRGFPLASAQRKTQLTVWPADEM